MNNLAEVISENIEEEKFVIDNDVKAEWALKKIAVEKVETQRYINVCETMISEYKFKIEQANKQLESGTSYIRSQLQQYFETVDKKKTKTQETYKLPSGVLKKKYPAPEFVKDEEILIKWLKDSNMNEYVKIKETTDWINLKKSIYFEEGKALTNDGEIIEGIKVQERPPVFEIEI